VTRLPSLKPREVIRILERAGYYIDHTSGGHYIMRHPDRPGRIPVPYHGGRDIKRGTLRSIISQSGLTVEEFLKLR
jgi:predicted RNA binding protein YcfA (HicA-like mRNA interferase family)